MAGQEKRAAGRDAKLYHADAAGLFGVAESTWRDRFHRGRTPGAVDLGPSSRSGVPKRADGFDLDGGHVRPWWHLETLQGWTPPGRGKGGGRKPKGAKPAG